MFVGILGLIGSGKGTVASRLVEKHNFRQDSFAASLKDACANIFGWERHLLEGDTKESRQWREEPDLWWARTLDRPGFSPRQALQLMGTDVIRNGFDDRIWMLSVLNRHQRNSSQSVVISDVRFKNEVDFIKNNSGRLIHVIRGELPVWYTVAQQANSGDLPSLNRMLTEFSTVHRSEWDWVGAPIDFLIHNDGTLDDLYMEIDKVVEYIKN